MKKILMVCLGNICRSPIAEGVMREKLAQNNIPAVVDSCGFESFHIGDAPDPRAIKVAKENGIDISNLRARLFRRQDFELFDHIFVMDSNNYRDVSRMSSGESDLEKVDYLMNLVYPGKNLPIPDPYSGDMDDFRQTYAMAEQAVDAFIQRIKKSGNS
ncbi:MAG: low molecular weight phosphotyrosine protein phosphatase [Lentimicrobiaceae bacterium]|nr:low molecular weight phosphotyrosine protein phosphatase [Lentimicrobiaceae bacterium]